MSEFHNLHWITWKNKEIFLGAFYRTVSPWTQLSNAIGDTASIYVTHVSLQFKTSVHFHFFVNTVFMTVINFGYFIFPKFWLAHLLF